MEVHFPHLPNGIAKATLTRRQRARFMRKVLVTAAVLGTLVLSASYGFASTMNQQMIANEEKLKEEVCYQLMVDINGVLFALTMVQKAYEMTPGQGEMLKTLTIAWNNYCK